MQSNLLQQVADRLSVQLTRTGATRQPVDDWGWFNAVWAGGPFRRAHLERLVTDKVDIVHCVVMPHLTDPAPVYGFDAVAMNGQLTGLFLDMTPMTNAPYRWWPVPAMDGEPRSTPEWADFFSDDFIAVVPTEHDLWSGTRTLRQYLRKLGAYVPEAKETIRAAQQQYTENQRHNPKTRRMLAAVVGGPERADAFIDGVLWPDVEDAPNG